MTKILKVKILCSEKTYELHQEEILLLIKNYLQSQAYDDYEFEVKWDEAVSE